MTKSLFTPALVIAALTVGVGLKAMRYVDDGSDVIAAAHAHVSQTMSDHGWSEQPDAPGAGAVLSQRVFTRAGCPEPVFVALLGGNAEGAAFFKQQHNGNAAFIQDAVVAHPSGLRRQLSGLWRDISGLLGGAQGKRLPVLAVAPAPDAAADCSGPPPAAWRTR